MKLSTFTPEGLETVTPWFRDPDTQRRLIGPEQRRRGLGRAMIAALMAHPDVRAVELFEAGVEPDNTASRRCLEAAGFTLRSPEPDFEGMLYYRRRVDST